MECLLPYFTMGTVPQWMVGSERMSDYRSVGLERFHCTCLNVQETPSSYGGASLQCIQKKY